MDETQTNRQATLSGGTLDAVPAGAVGLSDVKCAYVSDDTGERCGRFAVIGVELDGVETHGGHVPVCDSHAAGAWLQAARDADV